MSSTTFTINVDAGYLFDFIAIYDVKIRKTRDQKNIDNFVAAIEDAARQLGDDKLNEVLNSEQYKHLREINAKVFDLVDKAKTDEVKASEVDTANYDRYLAKRALQATFFGAHKIIEQKVGYEKTAVKTTL